MDPTNISTCYIDDSQLIISNLNQVEQLMHWSARNNQEQSLSLGTQEQKLFLVQMEFYRRSDILLLLVLRSKGHAYTDQRQQKCLYGLRRAFISPDASDCERLTLNLSMSTVQIECIF